MDNSEPAAQSSSSGTPKLPVIIGVIILLLLAGIGGYMVFGKNLMQKPAVTSTSTTAEAPSPTSGSVISSIREALAGSQSLQCDFTDESGRKTVSYMKSGMVRSDFAASDPKQSGSMIMKDKKMYFWNGKTGTMMTFDLEAMMDKVTQTPQTSPAAGTTQNPEDFVESLEKYKQSCRPATLDDEIFTPPSDVKFTDLSSMMQGVKTGASGVPSITEEQIKAMQEAAQQ